MGTIKWSPISHKSNHFGFKAKLFGIILTSNYVAWCGFKFFMYNFSNMIFPGILYELRWYTNFQFIEYKLLCEITNISLNGKQFYCYIQSPIKGSS